MLILDRKIGQQILIGNGTIQLKVLDYDKNSQIIRLGFKAPNHIDIDREEVFLRKMLLKQTGDLSC